MKTVALGELVDFYSGGTPTKSKPEFWQGDVPWFSAKDMKKPRLEDSTDHISEKVFSSTSLRKLPAGTIAMVVRGMILAHTVPIAVLDAEAAINQDLKALLPKREVDTSFLAAMLRAQHATILAQVSTAAHGTKKLDSRVLEELRIPYPPLPEQRRIAAILDHADALRIKRRQVLAHLDSLTQAIFHDMFGAEDSCHEFGSVIRSGPTNGMYRPASDYGYGTPILRIDGFGAGDVLSDSSTWKRLRADESEIQRYSLKRGDIVVNRVNALSHLGKSALVADTNEPSVFESNMMRIRVDTDRVERLFVLAWLQSKTTKRQILRKAKKAINQASINQTDVRSLLMPVPSLELQREFALRAERVATYRAVVDSARAASDELFASLQSRAFRGES